MIRQMNAPSRDHLVWLSIEQLDHQNKLNPLKPKFFDRSRPLGAHSLSPIATPKLESPRWMSGDMVSYTST